MCRRTLSGIVAVVLVVAAVQVQAKEGANWLDNGDFEWKLDCGFWSGSNGDNGVQDDPVISIASGSPCSHARLRAGGSYNATLQQIKQEVEVTALADDWIVLRFDASAGGSGGPAGPAVAQLTITGDSTGLKAIPLGGYAPYTLALKATANDPTVTVLFRVCTAGDKTYRLDVDNVAVTVETEPETSELDTVSPCIDDITATDFWRDTGDTCCEADCGVSPTGTRPNGVVDFHDILGVLDQWLTGQCNRCNINADDDVDFDDLLEVLSAWGPCDDPDPISLEDALDCEDIDEDCADDMEDTLENGTAAEQADVICWIEHYESCHCPDTCVGGPTGCGPDPCGIH